MKKYFKKTASILLVIGIAATAHAQTKVWFDTDIMIGLPERAPREVDDGVTLIMALKQPGINIVGISTVTYPDYGYGVTQKILQWHNTGAAIPVYKGSPKADDPGVENEATRALYQALKKEHLTILALGPVTNVATVMRNHPEIIPKIDSIILCIGRTPGLKFSPGLQKVVVGDYNYEKDTTSFNILLDSKVNLVLAGYEPSAYTLVGKIDIANLENGDEADKWLYAMLRPWQQRALTLFGVEGFIPYDCAALGVLTHPQFMQVYRNIPVQVNRRTNDATIGQNRPPVKNFLEVDYKYNTNRKVQYVYKILPGFEELILESLPHKKQ